MAILKTREAIETFKNHISNIYTLKTLAGITVKTKIAKPDFMMVLNQLSRDNVEIVPFRIDFDVVCTKTVYIDWN